MAQTDAAGAGAAGRGGGVAPVCCRDGGGQLFPGAGAHRPGGAGGAAAASAPVHAHGGSALLGIVLLCSLVHTVGTGAAQILRLVGALAIAAACTAGLQSVFAAGQRRRWSSCRCFSAALLTTLSASVAATGAVTTAAALHAGTAFFLQPAAASGHQPAAAAGLWLCGGRHGRRRPGQRDADPRGGAAEVVRDAVPEGDCRLPLWLYLTLSGVVSGSADGTAVKAVKLAVSTAVPVVGLDYFRRGRDCAGQRRDC